MANAVWLSVEITPIICSSCGVAYGINEEIRSQKAKHGGNFYCTNGHSQVYTKSELALVKESLAAAERRVANLRDEVNVAYAGKAVAERKLKRVQRGTCPQCNRHFVNVERHMKTKHAEPDHA